MTFIEAAADVLSREGKPLHAKDIAEKAISLGLLSHVGKTPVQTMSAQLSAAVLRGNAVFARVRPGVFALTEWKGKPPGAKRAERSRGSEKTLKTEVETPIASSVVPSVPKRVSEPKSAASVDRDDNFDDELQKNHSEDAQAPESASSKKRKRRRKKASRSAVFAGNVGHEAPSDTVEETDPVKHASHLVVKVEELHTPAVKEKMLPAPSGSAVEEIADAVEKVLRRASRPLPVEKIQEELGLFAPGSAVLMEALLASDSFEREKTGRMSRFVKHKSGYALVERETSGEIVSLESQAAEIKRRLAQLAERQLLRKLRALPTPGFVRTMMIFLERLGFGAAKPAPLKLSDGFHLSVRDRRRGAEFRTAVVLRQDSADHVLSEREVMDLRGAMHHFNAAGGMIFTTGQVGDKARAEGRVANLPPVTAVDGETLAGEMVSLGIGVKERVVHLPVYDDGFFVKLES